LPSLVESLVDATHPATSSKPAPDEIMNADSNNMIAAAKLLTTDRELTTTKKDKKL